MVPSTEPPPAKAELPPAALVGAPAPPRAWGLRFALAALEIGALLGFARPGIGLPLDDAWIHQVVGRTFAATGTLGYTAGHHGAAATSYLWAAILGANFRLFHIEPALFAFLVNGALLLVSGQCFFSLLIREKPEDTAASTWRFTAFVASLLATVGGNVLFYAHSGMEASLVLALVLASVLWATSPSPARMATVATGLLAGLLALTRPETIPFGALLVLLRFRGHRRASTLALAALPWLACMALYFGSNLLLMKQLAPQTLSGRRWLWFDGTAGLPRLAITLDLFDTWLSRLQDFTLGVKSDALFVVSLVVSGLGLARVARRCGTGTRAILVFAALHLAFYLALMPSPGHGGRYQPFIPFLYGAGIAFGLQGIVRVAASRVAVLGRGEGWAVAAACLPFAFLFGIEIAHWNFLYRMAVKHIRDTELAMGEAINQLPADAKVASFDIGGTGYAATRPIIDAGGLSDPGTAKRLMEGRLWEELRDQDVRYLVLPVSYDEDLPNPTNFAYRLRLAENPAVELDVVTRLTSPRDVWVPSITSTWNSSPTQVLYRVTYTDEPAAVVPLGVATATPVKDELGALDWRDRTIADHSLGMLAAAQVHLEVRITAEPPGPMPPGSIALGPWGTRSEPPRGMSSEAYAGIVEPLIAPYVEMKDYGDGARMAVHAAARAQRRFADATCYPPLPPVPEPHPRHRIVAFGVLQAIAYGVPALALVAIAVAWVLARRRARSE